MTKQKTLTPQPYVSERNLDVVTRAAFILEIGATHNKWHSIMDTADKISFNIYEIEDRQKATSLFRIPTQIRLFLRKRKMVKLLNKVNSKATNELNNTTKYLKERYGI